MRHITDAAMASYWTRRVHELEQMRPITQGEASEAAQEMRSRAAGLREDAEAIIRSGESTVPRGRVSGGQAELQARTRAHHADLRATRDAAADLEREAHALEMLADAHDRMALEPEGSPLAQSIAEARQRRDYYVQRAGRTFVPPTLV